MIAGLEDITNGELYIDGKLSNDIPSKERDIAMVFQSYALYPNMNVYNNMEMIISKLKVETLMFLQTLVSYVQIKV